MRLIVDANILISALIKKSVTRYILALPVFEFYTPDFAIQEIANNKNLILKKSKLTGDKLNKIFELLLKNINVVPSEVFVKHHKQSLMIMNKIDKKDSLYIALALLFQNDGIWSNDGHFQEQKVIKVFTTKDLIKMILKNQKQNIFFQP